MTEPSATRPFAAQAESRRPPPYGAKSTVLAMVEIAGLCFLGAWAAGMFFACVFTWSLDESDGAYRIGPVVLLHPLVMMTVVCTACLVTLGFFPIAALALNGRRLQQTFLVVETCVLVEILALAWFSPAAALIGSPVVALVSLLACRRVRALAADA